jgi:hypothetical protein
MSPNNPKMPQKPEDWRRWCVDHATEDLRRVEHLIKRQREVLKLDSKGQKRSADMVLTQLLRIRATLKREIKKWKFMNTGAQVARGQTLKPIKVTFDTNVWRRLVTEPSQYPALREKIVSGEISPYVTEISVSLESIQKIKRQEFFRSYMPSTSWAPQSIGPGVQIHAKFTFGPNTASHPGLHTKLSQNLLKAQELGFKVIRMTNIGTVRSPEIPKEMLLTVESRDAFWDYAQRLTDCHEFIKSLGCGYHDYEMIKQTRQPGSPDKLAAAIAEWVDGDALAAHYAFGADVFCTNDRARGAGSKSIFYPGNLAKLKERFPIVVLGPDELLQYSPS